MRRGVERDERAATAAKEEAICRAEVSVLGSLGQPGRVEARMHFLQGFDGHVGVNGGRLHFRVAEHFLHVAHVAAVLQQQGCERVPEEAAASAFADAGVEDDFRQADFAPGQLKIGCRVVEREPLPGQPGEERRHA